MKKIASRAQVLLSSWLMMVIPCLCVAEVLVEVADTAGNPLKDAVVYIESDKGHPSPAPKMAEIVQKGKRFNPMVTVVQTGTSVNFPNQDSVRHHVYSFSPIKKFELKLYSGVPANPVVFDKAGTAVLGCNIHDTMLAYVHVVDTPYFSKTDSNGIAHLPTLKQTGLQLKVWHYAQKNEQAIHSQAFTVQTDQPIRIKLDIQQAALVN
jgi:plastocyanin